MKSWARWIIVALYLAALPFTRAVWDLIRERSATLAEAIPLSVGVSVLPILALYLYFVKRERRVAVFTALGAVCVVYGMIALSLSRNIERVHLAQYAAMSVLVYWAMGGWRGGMALCPWAVFVTVELGLADESVQGLLPARIYDLNDVFLNAKGALIGQALVAFVLRPWEWRVVEGARAPSQMGGAFFLRVVAALVVLLLIFNICMIEKGTPTIRTDVHREDGALKGRDGFRHFAPRVLFLNAAVAASAIFALWLSRGPAGEAFTRLKTVIICGLIPPLVILAGRLAGLRFR